MKHIKLSNSDLTVLVDDEDFEYLNQFKWYHSNVSKNFVGYAARSKYIKKAKYKYSSKKIYMHREIMNNPELNVDHINGNTLNNCKSNLRVVEHLINMRNRKSVPGSTSIYVGVHFHKGSRKWRAQIKHDNKTIHIGTYNTQEEAYSARLQYIESKNLTGFKRK